MSTPLGNNSDPQNADANGMPHDTNTNTASNHSSEPNSASNTAAPITSTDHEDTGLGSPSQEVKDRIQRHHELNQRYLIEADQKDGTIHMTKWPIHHSPKQSPNEDDIDLDSLPDRSLRGMSKLPLVGRKYVRQDRNITDETDQKYQ